jgi:hypothetical protein
MLEGQQEIHKWHEKYSIASIPMPRFSRNYYSVRGIAPKSGQERLDSRIVALLNRLSKLDLNRNHRSIWPLYHEINFADGTLSILWVFEVTKKMDLQSMTTNYRLGQGFNERGDMIRRRFPKRWSASKDCISDSQIRQGYLRRTSRTGALADWVTPKFANQKCIGKIV